MHFKEHFLILTYSDYISLHLVSRPPVDPAGAPAPATGPALVAAVPYPYPE